MAEHIGAILGIAMTRGNKESKTRPDDNNVDQKVFVGDALKEITTITHV